MSALEHCHLNNVVRKGWSRCGYSYFQGGGDGVSNGVNENCNGYATSNVATIKNAQGRMDRF